MAEDKAKKSKIDIRARLGKSSQPGSGPSSTVALPVPGIGGGPPSDSGLPPPSQSGIPAAPPSSIPGSIPAPRPSGFAPPAGISPGIPLPPFGAQPRPQHTTPSVAPAHAQTIKVEVGEEVEQERAKARKRTALYAVIAAIVGIGMGFVAGDSSSTGNRLKQAARGAGALEKEVKAAGDKLRDLDAKVAEGLEKIKGKNYPDDLSAALAGITIPFDSTNLDGKGVGSLSPRVLKSVLNFTGAVEDINKSRETLRNLIGMAKEPVTKAWKEEKAPVANFSVLFRTEGGKQVVAELVPNKDTFAWKSDFPPNYAIFKTENGKQVEKKVGRYQKGDLPGNGDPVTIPVDPKTTAAFTSEVVVARLMKAIYDMRSDLQGNQENPTNPTPGLLKQADDLANELHKASLNQ